MAEPEKRKFSFDKLNKMEKGLYSREEVAPAPVKPLDEAARHSAAYPGVPQDWKEDIPEHLPDAPPEKHLINPKIMHKLFIGAGIFFVLSLGFGAFIFLGGLNRVSTDKVAIVINGPVTIGAGEPLSYDVSIRNDNNVALESVKLLIDYPEGTRSADEARDLPRDLEELGTISEGQSVKRTKEAVIFGEADSSQHVIISIEYRVKDSSATYFKEQYYDLLISTAPVRMTINSVEESVSGNEVEFTAEVVSNSTTVLQNMILRIDYPFGFQFSTASPSPTYSNNIFVLGDLAPADRRLIRIRGTVTGQEGDSRLFRFSLGLPDKGDNKTIGTVFLSSTKAVAIKRPFVSATLTLNDSSNDVVYASPGQPIRGEISWANNLDSRVVDFEIKAKLSGASLNRLSVNSGGSGFYRSVDDTIVWDKTTADQFAVIEPGENGIVTFSFASQPLSSLMYSGQRGNELSLDISVNARKLSGGSIPEQIVTGLSRKIRISSNLTLSGKSLYFSGPFTNQGSVPPQADRNTTYTIVWSLTNSLNSASGVKVTAVLPGNVTWLENVSPDGEAVNYDPVSREVVWDVGDLPAGTGFSNSPREVYFQVATVPSLSQVGNRPDLIGQAVVTGVDRYSNETLRATTNAITTLISDAPAGMDNPGTVRQ